MGSFAPTRPVVDIPLSVFSGLDTELSPETCPEGISPDTQDMAYTPGSVDSRDGLHKLLNPQLPNSPTIVYQKTFLQQNGNPLTLVLDSNGIFWQEDVSNTPGTVAQFGSVPPGSYAQSVTAFGREYIAISDLLHGQGVPLQYDGLNLDRVSQDGPGVAPFASEETISYPIVAAPLGLSEVGTDAIFAISEVGFIVTVEFLGFAASTHYFVGQQIQIAGVATGGYNGTFLITGVSTGTFGQTFVTYTAAVSGLGPDNTGTGQSTLAFGSTTIPNNFAVGMTITIAGAGIGGYDGTWVVHSVASPTTFSFFIASFGLAASGGGTAAPDGIIDAGVHQAVVIFLTRQGALTAPSPPATWTASGGKRVVLSSIPIGPANVIARVIGMTGAGGGNFFTLLTTPKVAGTIVGTALIIPDNTTTTATFDIADSTLFAGIAIDQIGNDLFDQVVLGPCAGFFAYASRLFAWGEWNKVQNFLNMGFDGGMDPAAGAPEPLGWQVFNGPTLVAGGAWASGFAVRIVGDGTPLQRGLSQSAYQDYLGNAIIEPSTSYLARIWAQLSAPSGGNIVITLSAGSTGFLATATIPLANVTAGGNFVQAFFDIATPATIPTDLRLTVSEVSLGNGTVLLLDEAEIIFTKKPYLDNIMRASYALNPEAFAQTTGTIGPADDTSPIRCNSLQRASVLLKSAEGTHIFQSNDFEPNKWSVDALSRSVGTCALRAGDPGLFGTGDAAEDWDISFNQNGAYLFAGGDFWKISQEMQPDIDAINWSAQETIWVKNDIKTRRAYFGVPTGEATAPNLVLVMDYRELDTASQIAAAAPVRISLAGKMICSDLTRKWSKWNIQSNSAEVLLRPGNLKEMTFGAGNGQAPGSAPGFGNFYYLDPLKLTDDDYGQIFPYYTTYGFVNHEQEQALGLGSHRKLVKKVCAFINGVGNVFFTPLVNSLKNPLPDSSTRQLLTNSDPASALKQYLEWTTSVRGEWVFFKWQVSPLVGQTDVKLSIQKMVVTMTQDPVAVTRSSRL